LRYSHFGSLLGKLCEAVKSVGCVTNACNSWSQLHSTADLSSPRMLVSQQRDGSQSKGVALPHSLDARPYIGTGSATGCGWPCYECRFLAIRKTVSTSPRSNSGTFKGLNVLPVPFGCHLTIQLCTSLNSIVHVYRQSQDGCTKFWTGCMKLSPLA